MCQQGWFPWRELLLEATRASLTIRSRLPDLSAREQCQRRTTEERLARRIFSSVTPSAKPREYTKRGRCGCWDRKPQPKNGDDFRADWSRGFCRHFPK